jgi:hypothetical protein
MGKFLEVTLPNLEKSVIIVRGQTPHLFFREKGRPHLIYGPREIVPALSTPSPLTQSEARMY